MKKIIAIGSVIVLFILAGCGVLQTAGSERDNYVKARTELLCYGAEHFEEVEKQPEMSEDELFALSVKIFDKHGIKVKTKEDLDALAKKFENDPVVEDEIKKGFGDCMAKAIQKLAEEEDVAKEGVSEKEESVSKEGVVK